MVKRLLDHPWVNRAGNVSFLVGIALFVVRLVSGWSSLTLLTVVLIAVGVAVMLASHREQLSVIGHQIHTPVKAIPVVAAAPARAASLDPRDALSVKFRYDEEGSLRVGVVNAADEKGAIGINVLAPWRYNGRQYVNRIDPATGNHATSGVCDETPHALTDDAPKSVRWTETGLSLFGHTTTEWKFFLPYIEGDPIYFKLGGDALGGWTDELIGYTPPTLAGSKATAEFYATKVELAEESPLAFPPDQPPTGRDLGLMDRKAGRRLGSTRYFHAHVTSAELLPKVEGFAIKLERLNARGEFEVLSDFKTPHRLRWDKPYIDPSEYLSNEIGPDTPGRLNLVNSVSTDGLTHICVPDEGPGMGLTKLGPGEYRLTVRAKADGYLPADARFLIHVHGQWNQLQVKRDDTL